jgi:signal transduction histidine kinase
VEFAIAEGLRTEGDPSLLRAVLLNLFENGWKFTGRRADARIEFGAVDGTPAFYVRDNGAGFDPTLIHKLFNPFQRLHAASDFDGTGIGLATAERIVKRHGGRIWAEGAVGQGATFYFNLAPEG